MFDMGRFEEALAAFEAATALAPADADAWCSRAGALRELGRLAGVARGGAARPRASARLRRGGDQPRQRAPQARPHGGGARRLSPRRRRAARLRPGHMRRSAGVAQSRALRRSARGLRGRRGAGQPRSCRRQGLPPAHPRRFRARLGGLRGALASRASRSPRRSARAFRPGAGPAGRASACSCSTTTGSATRSSSSAICR